MTSVAGITSTLSKHPALFPENAPQRLVKAIGSQVWDEDGRQFTDWISGLLAVTLGHNHPEVTEAVTKQLRDGGPTWSLSHPLEEEVATTILRLTGFEDGQVRFVKTGSEACSAAVRIARAVTGKKVVLSSGYHGWHDPLLAAAPAWGVPDFPRDRKATAGHPTREGLSLRTFESHKLEAASHPFWGLSPEDDGDLYYGTEDLASHKPGCVIVEPVTADEPPAGYFEQLRKRCDEYGALLIFDECITGGRYPEFTAARHYGVKPDLLVLSKGLANGYPLACVVGTREVMRCFDLDFSPEYGGGASGPVYVSGTWSGETAGLAAAKATLAVWERDKVADKVMVLGRALRERLTCTARLHAGAHIAVKGPPYRLLLECQGLDTKTALMGSLVAQGHLIGAGWNLTAAHSQENICEVEEAFHLAVCRWANGESNPGRPIRQAYRQA